MIKAVLKKGEKIATKETCSIVTHNVIENNARIQDGEKAYNSFALTLNEGNSYIEALRVEVMVTYPKKRRCDREERSEHSGQKALQCSVRTV